MERPKSLFDNSAELYDVLRDELNNDDASCSDDFELINLFDNDPCEDNIDKATEERDVTTGHVKTNGEKARKKHSKGKMEMFLESSEQLATLTKIVPGQNDTSNAIRSTKEDLTISNHVTIKKIPAISADQQPSKDLLIRKPRAKTQTPSSLAKKNPEGTPGQMSVADLMEYYLLNPLELAVKSRSKSNSNKPVPQTTTQITQQAKKGHGQDSPYTSAPQSSRLRDLLSAPSTNVPEPNNRAVVCETAPLSKDKAVHATVDQTQVSKSHALATISKNSGHAVATISKSTDHAVATISKSSGHAVTTTNSNSHELTTISKSSGDGAATISKSSGHAVATISETNGHAVATISKTGGHAVTAISKSSGHAAATISKSSGHALATISNSQAVATISKTNGHAVATISKSSGHAVATISKNNRHAVATVSKSDKTIQNHSPAGLYGSDSTIFGDSAIIGDSATSGDSTTVGDSAIVGDGSIISDSTIIGDITTIGDSTIIGGSAISGDSTMIGDGTIINEEDSDFHPVISNVCSVRQAMLTDIQSPDRVVDDSTVSIVPLVDNSTSIVPIGDNSTSMVSANDDSSVSIVPANDNSTTTIVPAIDNSTASIVPAIGNFTARVVPAVGNSTKYKNASGRKRSFRLPVETKDELNARKQWFKCVESGRGVTITFPRDMPHTAREATCNLINQDFLRMSSSKFKNYLEVLSEFIDKVKLFTSFRKTFGFSMVSSFMKDVKSKYKGYLVLPKEFTRSFKTELWELFTRDFDRHAFTYFEAGMGFQLEMCLICLEISKNLLFLKFLDHFVMDHLLKCTPPEKAEISAEILDVLMIMKKSFRYMEKFGSCLLSFNVLTVLKDIVNEADLKAKSQTIEIEGLNAITEGRKSIEKAKYKPKATSVKSKKSKLTPDEGVKKATATSSKVRGNSKVVPLDEVAEITKNKSTVSSNTKEHSSNNSLVNIDKRIRHHFLNTREARNIPNRSDWNYSDEDPLSIKDLKKEKIEESHIESEETRDTRAALRSLIMTHLDASVEVKQETGTGANQDKVVDERKSKIFEEITLDDDTIEVKQDSSKCVNQDDHEENSLKIYEEITLDEETDSDDQTMKTTRSLTNALNENISGNATAESNRGSTSPCLKENTKLPLATIKKSIGPKHTKKDRTCSPSESLAIKKSSVSDSERKTPSESLNANHAAPKSMSAVKDEVEPDESIDIKEELVYPVVNTPRSLVAPKHEPEIDPNVLGTRVCSVSENDAVSKQGTPAGNSAEAQRSASTNKATSRKSSKNYKQTSKNPKQTSKNPKRSSENPKQSSKNPKQSKKRARRRPEKESDDEDSDEECSGKKKKLSKVDEKILNILDQARKELEAEERKAEAAKREYAVQKPTKTYTTPAIPPIPPKSYEKKPMKELQTYSKKCPKNSILFSAYVSMIRMKTLDDKSERICDKSPAVDKSAAHVNQEPVDDPMGSDQFQTFNAENCVKQELDDDTIGNDLFKDLEDAFCEKLEPSDARESSTLADCMLEDSPVGDLIDLPHNDNPESTSLSMESSDVDTLITGSITYGSLYINTPANATITNQRKGNTSASASLSNERKVSTPTSSSINCGSPDINTPANASITNESKENTPTSSSIFDERKVNTPTTSSIFDERKVNVPTNSSIFHERKVSVPTSSSIFDERKVNTSTSSSITDKGLTDEIPHPTVSEIAPSVDQQATPSNQLPGSQITGPSTVGTIVSDFNYLSDSNLSTDVKVKSEDVSISPEPAIIRDETKGYREFDKMVALTRTCEVSPPLELNVDEEISVVDVIVRNVSETSLMKNVIRTPQSTSSSSDEMMRTSSSKMTAHKQSLYRICSFVSKLSLSHTDPCSKLSSRELLQIFKRAKSSTPTDIQNLEHILKKVDGEEVLGASENIFLRTKKFLEDYSSLKNAQLPTSAMEFDPNKPRIQKPPSWRDDPQPRLFKERPSIPYSSLPSLRTDWGITEEKYRNICDCNVMLRPLPSGIATGGFKAKVVKVAGTGALGIELIDKEEK
ncbi:hypothetical protein M8J75_006530 [Diaphorina citri]|nr:hypothetical protein M8J75_006530 [Diaphorina citri]